MLDKLTTIRAIMLARRSVPASLTWTAVSVSAPTALRYLIDGGAAGVPFVTFFPAILLAALFLGWRYAAITAVLSGVIANRLFRSEALLIDPTLANLIFTGLYAVSCLILIAIAETLRGNLRELEKAHEVEELLNKELRHRIKNILTVVQALATLAERKSPNFSAENLVCRLGALARATDALSLGAATTCTLRQLAENTLSPFREGENIRLGGSACDLPKETCAPLALVLHELCTNAIKYGSLSTPTGSVDINWQLVGAHGDEIALTWREEGGPVVTPPERQGMGSFLLRRQPGIEAVQLDYLPTGVVCKIRMKGGLPIPA